MGKRKDALHAENLERELRIARYEVEHLQRALAYADALDCCTSRSTLDRVRAVAHDWLLSTDDARHCAGRDLIAVLDGQQPPSDTEPHMALTSDPADPRLGHGVDTTPVPQNDVYLVLSEEDRAKGYVRPLRRSYVHRFTADHADLPAVIVEGTLFGGCGGVTTMALPLCETYAVDPKFYGATYCTGCGQHRPVAEFMWVEDGKVVGS